MLRKLCLTIGCLSAALLSGCLSTTTFSPVNQWDGRFSLIAQSDQHKENQTGRFTLQLAPQGDLVLDLKTALGNTLARIEYASEEVRLQAVGMKEVIGKNPEQLMNELLGFYVPLDGLAFWIDGALLPDAPAQTQPATAPYDTIDQLGWNITYRQFDDSGLPRRIVFERKQTPLSPALKITLIILERRHGTP